MRRAQHDANFGFREYCIYGSLYLESCFIYCTPPNPHVTIITIQPQRGRPGRLVLTELYTLMYWARRYAKRGKKFTSLPVSVVPSRNR